jgi:hypothetical protein
VCSCAFFALQSSCIVHRSFLLRMELGLFCKAGRERCDDCMSGIDREGWGDIIINRGMRSCHSTLGCEVRVRFAFLCGFRHRVLTLGIPHIRGPRARSISLPNICYTDYPKLASNLIL